MSDRIIGEIVLLAPNRNVPSGWVPCDGHIYNDVQTPNLNGRMPIGTGTGFANGFVNSSGPLTLLETPPRIDLFSRPYSQKPEEMPKHTHSLNIVRTDTEESCSGGGGAAADNRNNVKSTSESGSGDAMTIPLDVPITFCKFICYVDI